MKMQGLTFWMFEAMGRRHSADGAMGGIDGQRASHVGATSVIQPNGRRDHVTDRRECVRPLATQAGNCIEIAD
jgi:hypothetical protein